MLRCVVRSAIDLCRQRQRQQPTEAIDRLVDDVCGAGESAAEGALGALDRDSMAAALQDLRPDVRLLLYLRYDAGLSVQHIAMALGRPAGTVRRQCAEARQLAGERFLGRHLRPATGACAQVTDALCRLPSRQPALRVRQRTAEHLRRCPACRERQVEVDAIVGELGGRQGPR